MAILNFSVDYFISLKGCRGDTEVHSHKAYAVIVVLAKEYETLQDGFSIETLNAKT